MYEHQKSSRLSHRRNGHGSAAGLIDVLTDPGIALFSIYLLPIGFVTWCGGRKLDVTLLLPVLQELQREKDLAR